MFVVKKALSRRTVLRGIGTTLALPLLDAMVPALTLQARTAATPIRRFGAVYVPNGMAMEYWTPAQEGADFELTPILGPLAPYRKQLSVISGLNGSWRNAHAGASTSFLTGVSRGGKKETEILASVSMDQLMAQEFGRETQHASLELSLDGKGNAGNCGGFSCTYVNTISWRNATTPLPMESNPRPVFEKLFGDTGTTDKAIRQARRKQQQSILDSVTQKIAALKREIGPSDQVKVDEYLEAVRDAERRIQRAEEQSDREVGVVEQPSGAAMTYEEHANLYFDLQVLAYQADLTRVVTMMMGREVSGRTYPQIGVPDAHHPLSHHQNDPERIALMSKINIYHATLFASYLAKLRAAADGDGSLLDHLILMYGCGISNSTIHSPTNLPILLVGGGGGSLKGGTHLKYPDDTSIANLLVTVMDKMGMPVERIGNSTGKLPAATLSGI